MKTVVIIGAGPAGLTAAYDLKKQSGDELRVILLEESGEIGGISRTVRHNGCRIDLGGHRFFTKSQEVNDLWHEVLNEEFLLRPRLSRIYWNGKFLQYPLEGMDVIKKLGE